MYVSEENLKIIRSKEIRIMLDQYEEKFEEQFPYFNYADFQGSKNKHAAQEYKEILELVLKASELYTFFLFLICNTSLTNLQIFHSIFMITYTK